jgi:hypothetical protein
MFSPCCAFPYVASQPPSFLRGTVKVKSQWAQETGHGHSLECSNTGLHRARPLAKSLALRQPRRPVTGSQTPKLLPPFHCHITLRRNISLYCTAITSSLARQTMSLFAGWQPLYLASASYNDLSKRLSRAHCQWTSHFLSAHEQPSNCYCYVVPHLQ